MSEMNSSKRYARYPQSNLFASSLIESTSTNSDLTNSRAFSALNISIEGMRTTIFAILCVGFLPPFSGTLQPQY